MGFREKTKSEGIANNEGSNFHAEYLEIRRDNVG